jgi:hypothetical protein
MSHKFIRKVTACFKITAYSWDKALPEQNIHDFKEFCLAS